MKENPSTYHTYAHRLRYLNKHFNFLWLIIVILLIASATVAIAQGGGGGGGGDSGGDGNRSEDGTGGFLTFLLFTIFGIAAIQGFSYMSFQLKAADIANLVLILRNGAIYVPEINRLTLQANFQTDQGRRSFLNKLTTLLNPNDAIDGFLRFTPSQNAYRLWKRQKKAAEIQDLVINVALPNQAPIAWDNRLITSESGPTPVDDTYCIIGIIIESTTYEMEETRELVELNVALSKLHKWLKSNGDFYYYFGPTTTGVSLLEVQMLFKKVLKGK